MTGQLKTGCGTITRIDAQLPFLEYEFSWNDRTTNERKTAKCPFMVFSKECKEEFAHTTLKVGDVVQCEYEQTGYDKVLLKARLKPAKPFGGGGFGGKPKSPEERRSIELQSCLRITADVFIACLNKSTAPVAMDFAGMMKAIREQAEISANWIRDQSKGGSQ